MQYPVRDRPYRFVPPHPGRMWPALLRPVVPALGWLVCGVRSTQLRGVERLRRSLAAGHGVMLCPNHPRPGDPLQVFRLSTAVRRPFHFMAAWYLFNQFPPVGRWLLRRCGAFSVDREGLDREALKSATQILVEARRPLVVFPEGVVTRLNDRVCPLLDGPAFIARMAARQRAQAGTGRVVIHPVALKYYFRGNYRSAAERLLERLERRLTWRPRKGRPVVERVYLASRAVMTLKEIELFGGTRDGTLPERIAGYIDGLLGPLEKEWLGRVGGGSVADRVKRLRWAIVPDLSAGELPEPERARRWAHLADIHLAQAASFYPGDYVASRPTPERVLETLERFQEDTGDRGFPLHPYDAVVEVGEELEVTADRGRSGAEDPLTVQLQARIQAMLDGLVRDAVVGADGKPV